MQNPENISNPHQALYEDLFSKLNPMGKEEIDSASIAAFLRTAKDVNTAQLSQIWEAACESSGFVNRGFLNKLGIFMCFKLVAAVQQGFQISPEILCNPSLELPRFEIASGYNLLSRQQSTTSALAEENWAIGLNDLQKYEAIFNSLGPVDGRLSGNQCRPVLLNSQLPKGILAKIWDLADIDADGFLDKPEFCVALHLVYRSLQNDPMPERLPLALVPPEKRMLSRQMCPRSDDLPSTHPPPLAWSSRASSVASLNIQQQPSHSPPTTKNNIPKSLFERNVEEWRVEDLSQFELEFSDLDKDHDGFVGGNDVRDAFLRQVYFHPVGSGIRPLMPENPRVQELTASIESMQQKRRKAEEDLFQAEADLKVKNSEVKNLEIELLTLEATVKQLRVQRVEANKRLNDLDTRVAKLETVCSESQNRLEEEESRLQKTKADILQARENSGQEDIVLEQIRAEAQKRNERLVGAKTALEQQNTKFVAFVDELTQLERKMACQETESGRLKEQMEQMRHILEGVDANDENSMKELLEKTFKESLAAANGLPLTGNTFMDPFKNGDPFMPSNVSGTGPFESVGSDPFVSKSKEGKTNTNNFANFAKFTNS
ncbi:unnamed protein product [Meloidogyne enterolobii]|uniref:Uncharacterized protein n=1 Tax=Meloidogyne enterolobii TaxID=390850 RepID=A0ACB1B2M1_MELEN